MFVINYLEQIHIQQKLLDWTIVFKHIYQMYVMFTTKKQTYKYISHKWYLIRR